MLPIGDHGLLLTEFGEPSGNRGAKFEFSENGVGLTGLDKVGPLLMRPGLLFNQGLFEFGLSSGERELNVELEDDDEDTVVPDGRSGVLRGEPIFSFSGFLGNQGLLAGPSNGLPIPDDS